MIKQSVCHVGAKLMSRQSKSIHRVINKADTQCQWNRVPAED